MELEISRFRKSFAGTDGEPGFCLEFPGMTTQMGTIVLIMGPNGSGKTTLLRLLAGESRPSNECVRYTLAGEQWNAQDRPCGIVRQRAEHNLAMDLTVRENLLLGETAHSLGAFLFPRRHFESRLDILLNGYEELKRKLDQPAKNLSVGQRQTLAYVAVARGVHPFLFLDEFVSAADSATSARLRQLTRAYATKTPACVFIVSHNTGQALADGDRILVLKGGHILGDVARSHEHWNEAWIQRLMTE